MKKILCIALVTGFIAWYWYDVNTNNQVQIMGTQHDYTRETKFVSDSVFISNQAIIDSLTTVEELLTHLSSLPSNSTSSLEGPDDTEHTWVGGNGESFKE